MYFKKVLGQYFSRCARVFLYPLGKLDLVLYAPGVGLEKCSHAIYLLLCSGFIV
ncbi:hypothetical protein APHMUC_0368 [Anaplasma phagocytophilum str. ApMUC09]|uniref:Uncharacterized protein n=1 Tax=Anaplasma phagocytophilum str. ApMUC09 TaxID=1359152 RepID=A0A0F3NAJ8_ANAPH|nr:hypothetical protein APHMUC_0368 [Anaplasma phagocytophilum str. ApMUC09]